MHFTRWNNRSDTNGGHAEIEWAEFLGFVAAPVVAESKNALDAWSPGRFAENERADENTEVLSCIVLDDDSSGLPIERVAEIWAELAGVIHTTHSHTTEHPKYRIVLRCSRDMNPAEHARVWAYVRAHAAAAGQTLDEKTKNPSRLWYLPAHREGAPYEWRELEGEPLPVDVVLAAAPAEPAPAAPAPAARTPVAPSADGCRKAAAVSLAVNWPKKGTRHDTKLALAGALWRDEWPLDDAIAFGHELYAHVPSEDGGKIELDFGDTYRRADGGEHVTGWLALATHIDPGVVQHVRSLLNGTASMRAQRAAIEESAKAASPRLTTAERVRRIVGRDTSTGDSHNLWHWWVQ